MEVIDPTPSKGYVNKAEMTEDKVTSSGTLVDKEKENERVLDRDVSLRLELELLQDRLRQRDGEIAVVLRMLKQERKRAGSAETALALAGAAIRSVSPVSPDRLSPVRLAKMAVPSSTASTSTCSIPAVTMTKRGNTISRRVEVGLKRWGGADEGGEGGESRGFMEDAKDYSLSGEDANSSSSHGSEQWRTVLHEG